MAETEIKLSSNCKLLGLDLGVSSIGWCLYEADKIGVIDKETGEVLSDEDKNKKIYFKPYRILDLGVFIFNALEDKDGKTKNVQRRQKRLQRRQRRRKNLRLKDLRTLFGNYFKVDDFIKDVINTKNKNEENPYELKVKGLTEKLTERELMIALYHYMKYRGFQSNRKSQDKADKENGKVLKAINELEEKLKGKQVTEYLLDNLKERIANNIYDNRMHNSKDNYIFSVSREKYEEEIIKILDKQIEFKVIDDKFKEKYLSIYKRRRLYSEGPGISGYDDNGKEIYSPYKVDFDKLIGKCIFDNEPRAPKDSMSAQKQRLLTNLLNFRYRIIGKEDNAYLELNSEQITKLLNEFKYEKEIKYSKLLSKLSLTKEDKKNIDIKGLRLGKKKYSNLKKKYDNEDEFNEYLKKELLDEKFFKGSDMIHELYNNKKIEQKYRISDDFYDNIANCLIRKKDDSEIKKHLKDLGYDNDLIDQILNMNIDAKTTVNLSINLLNSLNPIMEKGKKYNEALKELGYDHRKGNYNVSSDGHMPPIDSALKDLGKQLNNPVVKNTLIQMRKILNAIVDKYGGIDDCVVELARELKAPFEERREIRLKQLDNQSENNEIRNKIISEFPSKFKNYKDISKDDLIKYKLYFEQERMCPYSGEEINHNNIFDDDCYQIDHIIPFSISFDDSFNNKVLVKKESNQEKGNNLPLQCRNKYIEQCVKKFVKENRKISSKKRDNLLSETISENFKNRDLNDTSHLSKLAKELISIYILNDIECRCTSGGVTNFLRQHRGLNNKTHTYIKKSDGEYVSFEDDLYKARYESEYKLDYSNPIEIVDSDKITFRFQNTKDISFSKIKKDNDKLNIYEKKLNNAINSFCTMYDQIKKYFLNGVIVNDIQTKISDLIEVCSSSIIKEQYENILDLLNNLKVKIQKEIDEKNRSNHLHHALDAAIIGTCRPSFIKEIVEHNQKKKDGEKIKIPEPYKDFKKEVAIRVYEQNKDKMLHLLNEKVAYYKEKCTLSKHDVHVLTPVRQPNKNINGAISNETIYGVKKIKINDNDEKRLIKTVDIKKALENNIDSLKKDIEKIIYKETGNKAVYESIKDWIDKGITKNSNYPKLKTKNVEIKSFKIDYGSIDGRVSLSKNDDKYADNSDVVRVEVYCKKNDANEENLFIVPIYYHQIFKRNKENSNVIYKLMYKQGDEGYELVDTNHLREFYKLKCILPRYSFIEVAKKDGSTTLAYSGGAFSGFFEIYSPIGDYKDLEFELDKKKSGDQFTLTISTIKNIKVRNISILGKVS